MTVAYADLSGLANNLSAASGQSFKTAANALVESYANQIAATARAFAPIKTGALRDSIEVDLSTALRAEIGPHVPYAGFQEMGTRTRGEFGRTPYTITPKKPGGYLVFYINGKKVVTKKVTHPGIPPHPYMRPAFERVITPFGQSLAELGGSYVKYGPHSPSSIPTRSAA